MTPDETKEMGEAAEKYAVQIYSEIIKRNTKLDFQAGYEKAMEKQHQEGDVCPACGTDFTQGSFRRCGQSIVTECNESLAEVASLRSALEILLDSKMTVDENTVPRAGIEAAPEQVVFNWHCSYARIKNAREALSQNPSDALSAVREAIGILRTGHIKDCICFGCRALAALEKYFK